MRIKVVSVLLLIVLGSAELVEEEIVNDIFTVEVIQRDTVPLLSYFLNNNSEYRQVFNPTWVEPSAGTAGKKGLLIRTQDCSVTIGDKCVFCGGSAQKASILTFSEDILGKFSPINSSTIKFTPTGFSDSWGTEDPRMVYNPKDSNYYMMYTAYNGSSILLSLARTRTPLDRDSWEKLGPVFPQYQNSKSGALLVTNTETHYLFWGDSDIRVTKSNNITSWPSIGQVVISPRPNKFDSKLVESGPPPLVLSSGDYLFFYNSAEIGWPEVNTSAYHVGWVVLQKADPTKILARSDTPLFAPLYNWEKGLPPYSCNAPNVVFLEAAYSLGENRFKVFFGGADATIGSAIVQVNIARSSRGQNDK